MELFFNSTCIFGKRTIHYACFPPGAVAVRHRLIHSPKNYTAPPLNQKEVCMTRMLTIVLLILLSMPGMLLGAPGSKGTTPPVASPDTSAPDPWGYTWVKSTDPGGPTFQWVDITARGTLATGLADDNSVGPFPILFSFPYYWYDVTTFRIGSNGYITFGNQSANFASPFAQLPNTSAPNDMLAICAGDLDYTVTSVTPQCYYWTNGADSLVISYINVAEWRSPANPNTRHTFQVILSKQDSSIVFQYGRQQGRYDDTNNNTLCVGIENQTGQIGLNYTFSSTPPHALMPDSGLAIRIKRTVNTGLQVRDAGIVGGFNLENLAKVIRQGAPDTISAIVRNYGTADLTNARVTYTITRAGQPTVRDTVFIPSFSAGQTSHLVFPRLFTPAAAGTYTATFNVTVSGDVGPTNNTKVAEILSAVFTTSANTRLAFEAGTAAGSTSWTGGGGFAVDFQVPVERVRIDSVYIQIATVTAQPMTVEIVDGTGGVPGTVLATRSVNAIVGNNGVSFRSDSIRITNGRFFVGARGQLAFSYEQTPPISFRTWEYTNGYAPYRSRDIQDIMIRAVVRQEDAPQPPADSAYVAFAEGPSLGTVVPVQVFDDSANTRTLAMGFAVGMNDCILPGDDFGGYQEVELPPIPPTGVFDVRLKDPSLAAGPCFGEGSLVDIRTAIAPGQRDTFFVSFQEGSGGRPIRVQWPAGLTGLAELRLVDPITSGSLFNINMLTDTAASIAAPFTGFYVLMQRGASADVAGSVAGLLHADGCDSVRVTSLAFTWDTVSYPVNNLNWMALRNQDNQQNFLLPPTAPPFPQDAHLTYISYPGSLGPQSLNIDTLVPGRRYRLITDCTGTGVGIQPELPGEFSLSQNYPNPFNPSTRVSYSVPVQSGVRLVVYDILGREVVRLMDGEVKQAGTYEITWNGMNAGGLTMPSGTYFLRMEAGSFSAVKKLLLLK
jgi:hypothetical protein